MAYNVKEEDLRISILKSLNTNIIFFRLKRLIKYIPALKYLPSHIAMKMCTDLCGIIIFGNFWTL